MHLTERQKQQYEHDGFLVIAGFYERQVVEQMVEHFMNLFNTARGPGAAAVPAGYSDTADQPYPRLINMHTSDKFTGEMAMRPDLVDIMEELLQEKAVLQVTMFYLKPPGARGQALHQTHQFVTLDPLVSMWTALDVADRDVGQMIVVPGSHKHGLLEVATADTTQSFVNARTIVPPGLSEAGVDMQPGDVLLFHPLTIHGSYPNVTAGRLRRSFNCTYIGANAKHFEPPQGKHVSHLKD
ncbi:MAG TPA: phytanoyl-CoA dioxygenase family protein [Blastocatellia bacterium]|nr:phytanoyl-CoA dioxygenase family protein [Blastocatellia bacterium]